MRIGTKLLVTYLVLIGFIGLVTGLGLPRVIEGIVADSEQQRLSRQATSVADRLDLRLRSRADQTSEKQFLTLVDELLPDATLAIVNPNGVVVSSSRRELAGKRIENLDGGVRASRGLIRGTLPSVEGMGPLIVGIGVIQTRMPNVRGYSVVMLRDVAFVQGLAQPITRIVGMTVAIGLILALMAAWLVSRDLVRRLKATGGAAQALAEGDLKHRAPVRGADEITDLARHFNYMAERTESLVAGMRRSEVARKDLLVMVSHELRTPMTSIAGFAEALRDGVVQDEERKQRYYEIIAAEAARLNRLVNDVFDFAKLEAGQIELRMQALPIAAWLLDFVEGLRPVTEQANVQLNLSISPQAEPARVVGDRDRLDQVLSNLVTNALRFSPPGGIVAIEAGIDGDDVWVAVQDQGPGVAQADAPHIFDRFYQGANQGYEHKGAGFGLAIVKSLVEAHGGTVGLSDTPGGGATFWIRLRRVEPSA